MNGEKNETADWSDIFSKERRHQMTLRFKESQLGYFFSKEKLDSTRPPRRQPRNSLPNWIFITSGHFVVNYEGRCKKKK